MSRGGMYANPEPPGAGDKYEVSEVDLRSMTKAELLAEAALRGLEVPATLTKAELRAALEA